jgi:predicted transcriptional regulator
MAMTLRLPAELDRKLEELAEVQHSSKQAVVLRALEDHVARETRRAQVIESLDETSRDYADLITRLEDA